MANPYGNIAGASDRSEPGWEERLLAMVRDGKESTVRGKNKSRPSRLYAVCDEEMTALVTAAARRRGLTVSAYIRRATSAFVAQDLGLPFEDVVRFGPRATPFGQTVTAKTGITNDDGTGYGSWKVQV